MLTRGLGLNLVDRCSLIKKSENPVEAYSSFCEENAYYPGVDICELIQGTDIVTLPSLQKVEKRVQAIKLNLSDLSSAVLDPIFDAPAWWFEKQNMWFCDNPECNFIRALLKQRRKRGRSTVFPVLEDLLRGPEFSYDALYELAYGSEARLNLEAYKFLANFAGDLRKDMLLLFTKSGQFPRLHLPKEVDVFLLLRHLPSLSLGEVQEARKKVNYLPKQAFSNQSVEFYAEVVGTPLRCFENNFVAEVAKAKGISNVQVLKLENFQKHCPNSFPFSFFLHYCALLQDTTKTTEELWKNLFKTEYTHFSKPLDVLQVVRRIEAKEAFFEVVEEQLVLAKQADRLFYETLWAEMEQDVTLYENIRYAPPWFFSRTKSTSTLLYEIANSLLLPYNKVLQRLQKLDLPHQTSLKTWFHAYFTLVNPELAGREVCNSVTQKQWEECKKNNTFDILFAAD